MSVDDSKFGPVQELEEVVKLLHHCIVYQHHAEVEAAEAAEAARIIEEQKKREEAEAAAAAAEAEKQQDADEKKKEEPQPESGGGGGFRPKIVPPPPRAVFAVRKIIFRRMKTLIQYAILPEPAKQLTATPALDEFFSIAYEFLRMFRDVGIGVIAASFACNLCAHVGVRTTLDASPLVQWFLDVALLFSSLKRIVHLCMLGVSNAAMCRDMRLTDEDATNFVSAICRLPGEQRVVEAWACAIINLVGSRQQANGAMLLKHNVFEMLQRLLLLHGTEDATSARAMQALTCLAIIHFPPQSKPQTTASPPPSTPASGSPSGSPKTASVQ